MTLRVLHEVSMVGQGHFDPQARAGVHRVIVSAMDGLAGLPGIEQGFGAFATAESALGLECAVARETGLLPGTRVPSWRWRIGFRQCAAWLLPRWIRMVKVHPRLHPWRVLLAAAYRVVATGARPARPCPGWDVVHAWYHALPPAETVPGAARLLTVQDVIPILHPEWFPAGSDAYLRRVLASLGMEDWVLCSSHATRDDLLRLSPHLAERTAVIPYAADGRFCPAAKSDAPRVQRAHGLAGQRFFTAVGTREPRKNLPRLVNAYASAFAGRSDAPLLAIVGSPGWDRALDEALEQARGTVGGIRLLGRVPDEDLPGLLAGSLALVYPSLYEGFGLPPLEAMACGVPVITSNRSSLPEVVGDAALLVDPEDVAAIASAMRRLADDPALHADLAVRSLAQAGRFSWRLTAEALQALYLRIARGRPPA